MDNPTEVMIGGDHYDIAGVTPRMYAMRNSLDPDGANIVKYICRARRKGQFKLDIQKAIHVTELRKVWFATWWYDFAFSGHFPVADLITGGYPLEADQIEALHLAHELFSVDNRRISGLRRDAQRRAATINLVRHLQAMLDGEPNAP